MIYLNQAGTSWPKPRAVCDAVARTQALAPNEWPEQFHADHVKIAASFGIAEAERLLLTPGATSALAVAISDLPWEAGDAIAISGFEHHAVHRPATLLAARGVETLVVPASGDALVCLDALEELLRTHRVRLVAMTAATNVTGDLLPTEDIIRMAHSHGALALVDAAQTAGWIRIDVGTLDADLLCFAGHKGPHAPWGIGGLYVNPRVEMKVPSAQCELGAERSCAPMPGYCDVGSVDRSSLSGLAAGIGWMEGEVAGGALDIARGRIAQLETVLREFPSVRLHARSAPKQRMPSLAFTVSDRSVGELAAALEAEGIVASAGLQCAGLAHESLGTAPDGVLRLSLGPSLPSTAIDEASSILRRVLAR